MVAKFARATAADVPSIVQLLADDPLDHEAESQSGAKDEAGFRLATPERGVP